MKMIFACFSFFLVSHTAFSQVTDSVPTAMDYKAGVAMSAAEYQQKGRNQRTTAIILGAGGAVLGTVGFALTLKNVEGLFDRNNPPKHVGSEFLMMIAGAGLGIASIPYHISAAKKASAKLFGYR